MRITGKFLLVCAIWCFLDQAHSIPSHKLKGSLPRQPFKVKSELKNFDGCGVSKKFEAGLPKKFKADNHKLSIVGGEDAILGDWPWMVSLMYTSSDSHFCGGSLISKQWVITAAHCMVGEVAEDIKARLGDLDLDDRIKDGALPIDVLIDEIVSHPGYNSSPTANDIALLHLKSPVHFTENILPICLYNGRVYKTSEYYEGREAYAIGWGDTTFNGSSPSRLQETTVEVISEELCAEQYSNMTEEFVIDEKVICAASPGKDTCQGDSGGPLMILNEDDDRFYLGGITSGGAGCAKPNYAGLYTKVAQFSCWISDVIGEDF